MHLLQRPAPVDKLDGQPVEQLRMAGRVALVTEVLGRTNAAPAKKGGPLAVHRHAPHQRIVRIDQPASKGQAIGRRARRHGRQRRQHTRIDLIRRLQELAAAMDMRRPRIVRRPF